MNNTFLLENIYTNTLYPFELLMCEKKENLLDKSDKKDTYINILKQNICKSASEMTFEKYCKLQKLSKEEIDLSISKRIDHKLQTNFPDWVTILEEVLENIDCENISFSKDLNNLPFYHLLHPFLKYFTRKLLENSKKVDPVNNYDLVIENLSKSLYNELIEISNLVFLQEFEHFLQKNENLNVYKKEDDFFYKEFIKKTLGNKFYSIFEKYPVLARKLSSRTDQYIKFTSKIIKLVIKDRIEIQNKFDTKLLQINKISVNAGDQHNGETTAIIEFINSYKIVYKPTNVGITDGYNQFLNWINEVLGEKLRSFKVLDKRTYGWLEFVQNNECKTTEDVKTYYERAGILAGMAYFLNTRDFHFENVIASGDCPILIDHETIIGPEIRYDLKDNSKKIIGTVLESLLLPSADIRNQRICGFGSSMQHTEKSSISYEIINSNKDNMKRTPQIFENKDEIKNTPKLNLKLQHLQNFKTEFHTGFFKIYDIVLKNKKLLISNNSPIMHFNNKKIRHILRSTMVYGKLSIILNKPEFLSDATNYGLKLELLARAFMINENISVNLLESEREQMTAGDIPIFYTTTTSNFLTLTNNKIADVFELNAIDSVKAKIKKACKKDFNIQKKLIDEALSL